MKLLMRGLLFGEPLVGDVRLEHDYAVRMNIPNLDSLSSFKTREICLKFLTTLCPKQVELLQIQLINESKNISIRKPRYFENSKHHRLKLRIAQALTILNHQSKYKWYDYYLYAILHENNQTNVTYMYEFIVATSISQQVLINQMENLADLSTSSQSSLFAISFLFCVHNKSDCEFVSKLITLILPWTMGSNFNTRLYAQIAVYHLIKRFKIIEFDYLQEAIEKGLKESPNALEKLYSDIRFNFPEEFSFKDIADPILFVTAMPEDECLSSRLEYLSDVVSFKEARRLILLKRDPNKEQETHAVVEDVQRKMNPEIDSNDISSKQLKGKHSDMIVVASLIDKLPNIGGIARTCEVLGIKELVLDSAKHTQNKEFKNLSMTAENWINITEVKPKDLKEFLNSKQIAGYKIVGAEQTSNSVNFMEFEFPKKCVLLLGHEKEGIPADLIALLDYAVEIPQFGMVRSLNVHVTGALFMYEYCKQRLKSSE
ncbi:probable methyltransferase TARBP1 [Episyrphus balteatus]|uniref:probable methyltransferase TARBP1 n=1 Tax=Episyrphus balteatus TaxID=286459 RepID=UPI00248507A9|nr:probable methyltransferase TARBP1 [Episyrphus balteatus]